MKNLILLATLIFSQTIYASYEAIACSSPQKPLFLTTAPNDFLDLSIIIDHEMSRDPKERIKTKREKKRKAVISYNHQGKREFVLAQVEFARSGSRSSICKIPPIKLYFEKENIVSEVLRRSSSRNLKNILDVYKNIPLYQNFKGHKQYNNIFTGNGKSIKLITHCGVYTGNARFRRFRLGSEDEYQVNTLKEHYVHQMQMPLKTLTKDTRLARISYFDQDGILWKSDKWAFFREGSNSVAKRCGLSKKHETPNELEINKTSLLQIKLLNKFFTNADFNPATVNMHNVNELYSTEEAYYLPHDYDLASLNITYESRDLNYVQEQYSPSNFRSFLFSLNNDFLAIQGRILFDMKPRIESILTNSFIPDEYQDMMKDWMDSYFKALEESI